jgi:hypothetical protein
MLPLPANRRKTMNVRNGQRATKSASRPRTPAPSPSKAATISTTPKVAMTKVERNRTSTVPMAHRLQWVAENAVRAAPAALAARVVLVAVAAVVVVVVLVVADADRAAAVAVADRSK